MAPRGVSKANQASTPSLDSFKLLGDGPAQLEEDRAQGVEESDPPIGVRDGSTDRMAKEWAGKHRS